MSSNVVILGAGFGRLALAARLPTRCLLARKVGDSPGRWREGKLTAPTTREDDIPMTIRLSVYYPTTDGASFDHDYYRDTHVPLAVKTWGLDGAEIDKGVNGPYVAAVHFKFASLDALGAAMGAAGTADVLADVANYTSITPVMQTSEIVS